MTHGKKEPISEWDNPTLCMARVVCFFNTQNKCKRRGIVRTVLLTIRSLFVFFWQRTWFLMNVQTFIMLILDTNLKHNLIREIKAGHGVIMCLVIGHILLRVLSLCKLPYMRSLIPPIFDTDSWTDGYVITIQHGMFFRSHVHKVSYTDRQSLCMPSWTYLSSNVE